MGFYSKYSLCLLIAIAVSGCTSIKEQSGELLKFEQSKEGYEVANVYPESSDAPKAPKDVRSSKAWDRAAKKMIDLREGFAAPASPQPAKTPEQLRQEFEALKAKVDAYKLDDPQ